MKEPKFIPRPGQVDYTHARFAPIINCVLEYRGKLLLMHRNKNLRLYPDYWNGVSGFLDDQKTLEQKVHEELREELGMSKKHIRSIRLGQIFEQEDKKYKKTWIVHPVLVEVDTDKVKIDWEAQEYSWVTLRQAKKLKLMPGFDRTLREATKLQK